MIAALTKVSGTAPALVWHKDTDVPDVDLIVIPGGFSYGDYLRSGAIAARSPVMETIRARAAGGTLVLGVCNGFQVLTEAGLLPGVLMRNASLRFVCREVKLSVESTNTAFTRGYTAGQIIRCPVAHHDGNYFADSETLARLEGEGQVAFRYAEGTNPNGSINDIAGVFNAERNVLGLMPHPEDLVEAAHGGTDGRALFSGLLQAA
jgi:phosphoribosylformylglycinamidine synthase